MKTNICVIILCLVAAIWFLLLGGCAASPNAWRDLGDGQGMRGWAGIPLRQTAPLGLVAAGAHEFSRREWRSIDTYRPIPVQPFVPAPINPIGSNSNPVHVAPAWVPIPTP